MTQALGYVNWGNWVADCPSPDCTDARAVYPNGATEPGLDQTCANGHALTIILPADETDIDTVLAGRVDEGDRFWYPVGHPRAAEDGLPTGLTLTELAAEGAELNARRATGS